MTSSDSPAAGLRGETESNNVGRSDLTSRNQIFWKKSKFPPNFRIFPNIWLQIPEFSAGKKFHNKTMTSLGFHFFLLWSQWGSIPQFMNLEINLEFHIWKQIYFFWCSKKIVQCSLWCPAMSFLSFVERHETPGVPRLPVCWVSAYQPRVQPPDDQQWGCARQRPQGPKGPRPRRPEGPPSAQATL